MKASAKKAGIWTLVLVGALASGSALAQHHGHGGVRFGISLGVPFYGPGYYPAPYYGYPAYAYPAPVYAYPPMVVERAAPPVYIQQDVVQTAPAPAQGDWYYCAASRSYYPYVADCPAGWQRVPAQPAR